MKTQKINSPVENVVTPELAHGIFSQCSAADERPAPLFRRPREDQLEHVVGQFDERGEVAAQVRPAQVRTHGGHDDGWMVIGGGGGIRRVGWRHGLDKSVHDVHQE